MLLFHSYFAWLIFLTIVTTSFLLRPKYVKEKNTTMNFGLSSSQSGFLLYFESL